MGMIVFSFSEPYQTKIESDLEESSEKPYFSWLIRLLAVFLSIPVNWLLRCIIGKVAGAAASSCIVFRIPSISCMFQTKKAFVGSAMQSE